MKFYTPPEIAKLLKISPESVIAMIRRHELTGFDLASPGSSRPRFRITEAALQDFIARREIKPPTPTTRRPRKPATVSDRKDYFADLRKGRK